jgi:glycosyltransferase involved in cell wall biosynthesis
MKRRILTVFNRYLHFGGEEKSVESIYAQLSHSHAMERCFFDSRSWMGADAPSRPVQLRRMFYNRESRQHFDEAAQQHQAELAMFHNIYPVGSPALYHAALDSGLPIVQFLHNFRPFSVGGTLYANGKLLPEALRGNYWREVMTGSWQSSVLKSALFALLLKRLHRSGWLQSVRQWVAVSEFMRERIMEAGVPPERVTALRHFWKAMPEMPNREDDGSYLFLGRLVNVKGIEMLLQVWRELRAHCGAATPLLRIAGEGPMAARIQAEDNPSVQPVGMLRSSLPPYGGSLLDW